MSGTYMAISAVGVAFLILVYLLVAPLPDKKNKKTQPPQPQQKSKKNK